MYVCILTKASTAPFSAMNVNISELISPRLDVCLAIMDILIMVIALVGNALVAAALVRLLRKKIASNIFILSLVSHYYIKVIEKEPATFRVQPFWLEIFEDSPKISAKFL